MKDRILVIFEMIVFQRAFPKDATLEQVDFVIDALVAMSED
jgi:hypothetical protein